MSLNEVLEISTSLAPEVVLECLLKSVGLDSPIECLLVPDVRYKTTLPDFTATSFQISEDFQYSEPLGIKATIRVVFRTSAQRSIATNLAAIRMCLGWLEGTNDDLALLFEGQTAYFYRKNGQIIVNSNPDVWIPEHLALLTLPHEMKEIPNL